MSSFPALRGVILNFGGGREVDPFWKLLEVEVERAF